MAGAIYLAGRPRLWWLAAAPFFLNLALFALLLWLAFAQLSELMTWVSADLGQRWSGLVFYTLLVLAMALVLAGSVFLFTVVGRIVAAPFLDLLTRQVEREVLGPAGMPHEPSLAATMFRVLGHEARKLLLYLGVMGLLFLLNLLPGLGTLAYTILAGTATCFFLALELLDFPLERRGLSLRAKLAYVRGLGLTGLAFGLAALALGMVPVLNFTLLPLAAVGGTLLYLERPAQP